MSNGTTNNPPTVMRKIAVLGYRAVGKTQMINSFAAGDFLEQYDPTIESVASKTIRFRKVRLSVIQTNGGMRSYI
jgi:Ras family protein